MHNFLKKNSSQVVTLFSIGRLPYASGTFGSLLSFFVLSICYYFLNYYIFFIFFFIFLLIGHYSIISYTDNIKKKDAREIVIDEFLGCYLIFLFFPIFINENIYFIYIFSFIFFQNI